MTAPVSTSSSSEFVGDVAEIPDDCPLLIGKNPLEGMDAAQRAGARKRATEALFEQFLAP
jgi:hypothetical protein